MALDVIVDTETEPQRMWPGLDRAKLLEDILAAHDRATCETRIALAMSTMAVVLSCEPERARELADVYHLAARDRLTLHLGVTLLDDGEGTVSDFDPLESPIHMADASGL